MRNFAATLKRDNCYRFFSNNESHMDTKAIFRLVFRPHEVLSVVNTLLAFRAPPA
jgi:hypothetical protein